MSDDPRIRAMLGLEPIQPPLAPEAKPQRIDFSRCRVYAVSTAAEAMGLFKARYKVDAVYCATAAIGGRTKVEGWVVGWIPENWVEHSD